MNSIDKIETRTEKLSESINNLSFQFKNIELEQEADEAKQEAVASLERFLELAQQDLDERPENGQENSSDSED